MAVVSIKNPTISGNVKTFLSQDYSSGTTLNVDSSVSLVSGNYVVIGEVGNEKTEATNLTATPPSNTSLTVSALKFSHSKGTPVYYTRWDKYSLEYRTSSTGTWTAYGSMPASLSFDAINTEYRDSSATSSYQWRYRYYSTENTAYSDYSDIISAAGWGKSSVGYMVKEVRKIINDPESKTVSDAEIIRFFNAAQDKIFTLYDRWWFLLKKGTAISTVASKKIYDLPDDFGRMARVTYEFVDGDTEINYNLKYLTNLEFEYESRDQTADDNDEIIYYSIYPGDSDNATGYLHVWPTPETADLNIYPWYYKSFTSLDSYGDETEIPIPSMLQDYALAQIYGIRQQEGKADGYDKFFREQVELLKLMQKKQTDSLRSLWRYEGRKAKSRLFGTRTISDDNAREKYW